jgi:hypothetical protein
MYQRDLQRVTTTIQSIAPKLSSTRFERADVLETQLYKQRAATMNPGRGTTEK